MKNTDKQIAEIKAQTIGVEVEMNNITREKAAKIAADFFGTNRAKDTHARNGYCAWSAWDTKHREWKFQFDSSIHGDEREKCELVTPILNYNDIGTLQELIRRLRKAGAKSSASRGCGVHIHIGAQGHNAKTLRNLANIMASHEELLISALNISSSRVRSYCNTVNETFLKKLNEKKPETMSQLADIWYTTNNANFDRTAHYNSSRYHILNLHAVFTKGTIEFRLFQFDEPSTGRRGGLHAGQLKSYIQLCLALSALAKNAKSASPKPQQTENPKYAMPLGSFASASSETNSKQLVKPSPQGSAETLPSG